MDAVQEQVEGRVNHFGAQVVELEVLHELRRALGALLVRVIPLLLLCFPRVHVNDVIKHVSVFNEASLKGRDGLSSHIT